MQLDTAPAPAAGPAHGSAVRRVRRRRRLRVLALALAVLAAAGCIGLGRAVRQLSGRMARLEAAAVSRAELPAEEPAASGPEPTATPAMLPAGDYAGQWPRLAADPLPARTPPPKTVYLTFDDGPSRCTAEILDVMAAHDAAGTWFVVGTQLSGREDLVRRIQAEGHALALHSNTHEYNEIYASPSAFLADAAALSDRLADITGLRPGILRFAGGSLNHYNAGIFQELTAELLRRGLRYYDWNVSAQDAVAKSPGAAVIAARVIDGVRALDDTVPAVVLMHDTKATTPAALPEILDTLSAEGYTFAALDSSVPMVAFGYPDSGGTAP